MGRVLSLGRGQENPGHSRSKMVYIVGSLLLSVGWAVYFLDGLPIYIGYVPRFQGIRGRWPEVDGLPNPDGHHGYA